MRIASELSIEDLGKLRAAIDRLHDARCGQKLEPPAIKQAAPAPAVRKSLIEFDPLDVKVPEKFEGERFRKAWREWVQYNVEESHARRSSGFDKPKSQADGQGVQFADAHALSAQPRCRCSSAFAIAPERVRVERAGRGRGDGDPQARRRQQRVSCERSSRVDRPRKILRSDCRLPTMLSSPQLRRPRQSASPNHNRSQRLLKLPKWRSLRRSQNSISPISKRSDS